MTCERHPSGAKSVSDGSPLKGKGSVANPYAKYFENRDPLAIAATTPAKIASPIRGLALLVQLETPDGHDLNHLEQIERLAAQHKARK